MREERLPCGLEVEVEVEVEVMLVQRSWSRACVVLCCVDGLAYARRGEG